MADTNNTDAVRLPAGNLTVELETTQNVVICESRLDGERRTTVTDIGGLIEALEVARSIRNVRDLSPRED